VEGLQIGTWIGIDQREEGQSKGFQQAGKTPGNQFIELIGLDTTIRLGMAEK
jgi:hypothetical protein